MKISVIMGIYNCEKTLRTSIESLLNQSFQDFEIILCEDGSSDDTYHIAEQYRSQLGARLTLLRNKTNRGLAYSLNKCLSQATGQYIARMDADDIAKEDRFEKQVQFLDQHPEYALVASDAILFDDSGVWGYRKTAEKPQKEDFLMSSPFIHPTILIRKEILEEANGYAVEKATLRAEDYDLFMRLYWKGHKGYNIQEPLLHYREDVDTFARRAYHYRLDETRIRYRGFKRLKLLPKGFPYVIKPLIVGIIPQRILTKMRREGRDRRPVKEIN